ncbi:TIP-1 family-domain-containing protein [Dichotomocladium elegans]|nr:TIP-1 family-domain-containing protein [Dichotomocladium elegans]
MANPTLAAFLETTFQTAADVENQRLRHLLDEKVQRQSKLNQELEEARISAQATLSAILAKANGQKAAMDKLHASLAENKEALESSRAVSMQSEFNSKLAAIENKLSMLDNAKQYVKVLLVAADLERQSIQSVETTPANAIGPYQQLCRFTSSVKARVADSPVTEMQFARLQSHLDRLSSNVYQRLEYVLSKNFKATLEQLSWPTPIKPPFGPQLKEKLTGFEDAFRCLLLLRRPSDVDAPIDAQDIKLLPITVMLEALNLRFRFHFETSKPTNRVDKPEWYLSHTKTTISSHLHLLLGVIQPIVEDTLGKEVSAKDCFIRELSENVARKLRATIPHIVNKPHWMSHTVHEVLSFDQALRDDFAYYPRKERTMADVVIGNDAWFNSWYNVERKFAQSRYDEIILDSHAFEPYEPENNYESSSPALANDSVKPTVSATRLIHLFENITDSYKLVQDFGKKVQFFLGIQLNLLNQYSGRITSGLDAFEALSLGRSVPVPGALPESVTGVISSGDLGGSIASLRRLSRWWASARTIYDTLREIADDDIFLDLQYQARGSPDITCQVANRLKATEPALAFLNPANLTDNKATLFAPIQDLFIRLVKRTEGLMVKIIMKEWAFDSRLYARRWQMDKDGDDENEEISPELYQPLQNLRISCNLLSSNMPASDFVNIYRTISNEIEDWHMRNIIAPNRLTQEDLRRLATDLERGLWEIGRSWIVKPENYMRK